MGELSYQGRFVWQDLMTTDPEASQAFFTALFGWTTEAREMDEGFVYTTLKRDGAQFGRLVPLDAGYGIPSHWISYMTTEDVDAFCAKAGSLGATVGVEPTDIPEVGRFAVVGDPQGAHFSPFTETVRASIVAPASPVSHGGVAWNELATYDVEGASAFYTEMFGLDTQVMDVGTGPYTVLSNGGAMVARMMQKQEEMPISAWVNYFEVANADDIAALATELGGRVLMPPMDVPTVGRLTWIADPAGAIFAIMQSASQGEGRS